LLRAYKIKIHRDGFTLIFLPLGLLVLFSSLREFELRADFVIAIASSFVMILSPFVAYFSVRSIHLRKILTAAWIISFLIVILALFYFITNIVL